jgi:phosphatidylglycerol---prolipoprotein diacylglyceryl transferase
VFPELRFVLGGTQLVLSTHGLAIAAGVAAGAALAARRAREPLLVIATGAGVAVVALLGARALFVSLHGGGGGLWSGGLASTGGVLAGLAATWTIARVVRRSPLELLDALAPAGLLALAIGRVGCFLGGCCYGRPTSMPWAVVFPEVGPPARHPLQLYSAAADLALVALLPARAAPPGTVIRRACLGFGLVRAALETLRDPATTDSLPGGWLTLPQGVALLLAAAAVAASFGLRRRDPSNMAPLRRKRSHGR